jgi:dTDP-4-amino-4,6-dideoxyglucose formyltransferase
MKILIITDNEFIKSNMIEIFTNNKYRWEYSIQESINLNLKDKNIIQEIVSTYNLVISAHCKKIFPPNLVNNIRCINLHPGLNPYNRGWFPQVFSIINHLPIGATIHEIDNKLDHGPIIVQEEVKINSTDTSLEVYNKVIQKEIELFNLNLESIILNTYELTFPKEEGNLNLKKDFNKLCELDLNNVGTLKEHIDLLRALTHGDFYNAFFIEDGHKVYIKLDILK